MKRVIECVLVTIIVASLTACSSNPPSSTQGYDPYSVKAAKEGANGSRYTLSQDTAPGIEPHPSEIPDAVPRYERFKKYGNKSPYTVWGKTYQVMTTNEGYEEEGVASWYGKKFHGHKTSNGELFNMYAPSAAHKSLPIPSYARVTNLDNGKSVVVRVNDRGPFHGDRLIDLSYAAAIRLGYHNKGTANVRIQAIPVQSDGRASNPNTSRDWSAPRGRVVQIGSFKNQEGAAKVAAMARGRGLSPVRVTRVDRMWGDLFRVQLGPFSSEASARAQRVEAQQAGFYSAIVVGGDH